MYLLLRIVFVAFIMGNYIFSVATYSNPISSDSPACFLKFKTVVLSPRRLCQITVGKDILGFVSSSVIDSLSSCGQ